MSSPRGAICAATLLVQLCALTQATWAAPKDDVERTNSDDRSLQEVLSDDEASQIDDSINRGLRFLATQQARDGSFDGPGRGQPAITSLCVLAFLSRGYLPSEEPYGGQLTLAIEYVLANRRAARSKFEGVYNHAIAALMLSEVYGMTGAETNVRIERAIAEEIVFARRLQVSGKRNRHDYGGWRYLGRHGPNDSDLSATSWQLMFFRAAKNSGFDVPHEYAKDALGYVHRTFDREEKLFTYALIDGRDREHYSNRGIVGAGIVSLAMAGEHRSPMVLAAGEWLLDQPFDAYNRSIHPEERYHYSVYYCSQAMFQLGGQYWVEFYPPMASTLVANQRRNGAWAPESNHDSAYGNTYTTALAVLALTPPLQLLPIYQR